METLVTIVLAAGCLAAAGGDANAAAPLKVLLLAGRNNHNWKATTPVLAKTLDGSGLFKTTVLEDPAKMTPEMLAGFDAIVSNWCAFPKVEERPWGEAPEKAFLDFVKGGKGVVFVHAATATFHNWPEFMALAGGTWGKGTHHGANGEAMRVFAADPNHPIAKGIPAFAHADELWRSVAWQKDVHVVFRAKPAGEKARPAAAEGEPVAVCTKLGKGRGFYLVLGHDTKAMERPGFKLLLLRGTQWAAAGKVTVPVPPDLPKP